MATDEKIEQRLGEAPEDEDIKERLEREHTELLEELRALIPGAQVLFGFLLAIRFTSPFTDLTAVQRYFYYATLLSTAVALVLLLAPSAYHRLRFREGDKDVMVRKGNREAIAGTGAIALAFTGVLYLITDLVFTTQAAIAVALVFFALTAWRWWAIALYRKARERAEAKDTSADGQPTGPSARRPGHARPWQREPGP
jgi:amino acid transporter